MEKSGWLSHFKLYLAPATVPSAWHFTEESTVKYYPWKSVTIEMIDDLEHYKLSIWVIVIMRLFHIKAVKYVCKNDGDQIVFVNLKSS